MPFLIDWIPWEQFVCIFPYLGYHLCHLEYAIWNMESILEYRIDPVRFFGIGFQEMSRSLGHSPK